MSNEWIKCSDRLPPRSKKVLLYIAYRSIIDDEKFYIMDLGNIGNEGNDQYYGSEGVIQRGDVTHWQPLPEPPKEQDDGE